MWREATTEALPRMPPGDPTEQLAAFELKLIDMLCAQATADTARDVADKTWDLVHDRPDDDPVKRRVVQCHEALARLSARGGGPDLGRAPVEGAPGALRPPRQGALDRLPVRGGRGAGPAHAGVPARVRGGRSPRSYSLAIAPSRCRVAARAPTGSAIGTSTRARLGGVDRQPGQRLRRLTLLYPLLYMWTALYSFYFFPMPALAQWPSSASPTRWCSRSRTRTVLSAAPRGRHAGRGRRPDPRLLGGAPGRRRRELERVQSERDGSCSTPRPTRS